MGHDYQGVQPGHERMMGMLTSRRTDQRKAASPWRLAEEVCLLNRAKHLCFVFLSCLGHTASTSRNDALHPPCLTTHHVPEGATVAECPEEYLAAMDENGGIEDAGRQGSVPLLVGLPVRPQCPWTLEPEHAVNIKGGQVGRYSSIVGQS